MAIDADALVAAVESGETDRVSEAIDQVESLDADERMALLDASFDSLNRAYESEDGYRRQSVVRALDALYEGISIEDGDRRPVDPDGEWAVRLAAFYLRAIRDGDGRVRIATKRAMHSLCIQCNLRDDKAVVQALADRLDELAAATDDPVREHVEEAREQVAGQHGPLGAQLRTVLDDAMEAYDPEEWDDA